MKTLTVRLSEQLVAAIEAEARSRRVSKSDVIRERLERAGGPLDTADGASSLDDIADLIGSVDGLPSDLSERVDDYLQSSDFGRDRNH